VRRAVELLPLLPDTLLLALNVSPTTIGWPPFERFLAEAPGERIVLELTEHMPTEDYDGLNRRLAPSRTRGVRVAVDDAGAGYSTFRHILQLRPDIIKMDQSITRDIDTDPARRALATSLVIFAGEIGATVVAEGVETESELQAVAAAGILRGQGFAFSAAQSLPIAPLSFTPVVPHTEDEPSADEMPAWLDLDATVVVTAHGLLSAVGAIEMVLTLLRQRYGVIPEEEFRALVGSAERQARLVGGVLRDMVHGLPTGTVDFLNELSGTG